MTGTEDDINAARANELRRIEAEIRELRSQGYTDDHARMEKLIARRSELAASAGSSDTDEPVRREDREDPVTGRDLEDRTQQDAVESGLRRFR